MDYTLAPDRPVADEVRRVAEVQLREALASLDRPGEDVAAAVHDTRKRCKKLRGLVRLVRPALGDAYAPANAVLREAARELSDLRDAHAVLETFDALVAAQTEPLPEGGLAAVRAALQSRSDEASERAVADAPEITSAQSLLVDARELLETWELSDDGFDAVRGGLRKTYRRGREALAAALESHDVDDFHEYRKRTKYTWYHVRLLDELAPSLLGPFAVGLHALADALGDDHDLAVLLDQLHHDPGAFGGDDAVAAADALVTPRREELQDRAIRLGLRCHAETPGDLVDRFERYWDAYASHGAELPAGEIDDLWPPVDDGLDDLTVDELRSWARENDIPGRSKLRRDGLVAAIRADA